MLWKLSEPTRSSKYIPKEPEVKTMKANKGCLTEHYPSDDTNIPNTIDSFRKEMLSKEAWPFERNNERYTASLSAVVSNMTKPPSPSFISS